MGIRYSEEREKKGIEGKRKETQGETNGNTQYGKSKNRGI